MERKEKKSRKNILEMKTKLRTKKQIEIMEDTVLRLEGKRVQLIKQK